MMIKHAFYLENSSALEVVEVVHLPSENLEHINMEGNKYLLLGKLVNFLINVIYVYVMHTLLCLCSTHFLNRSVVVCVTF